MSLKPPESVQKLQRALHEKAKASPNQKFHALYDKVYRDDILAHAYRQCRANGGSPGVDGQTFNDIEAYGLERWLGEVTQALKERTYRPQPVRRVCIPKADGKQRPLGIPTVRDRVVQTAALLVLEPIFEADLQPEQYAYRSGRSALHALRHIHRLVNTGHRQVVDADLKAYFDTIPHTELMRSVSRRICDGTMLHLIKMWLKMPVQEEDPDSGRRRTIPKGDGQKGTPQGAPISPLLSNLYMRRFVLGWKTGGHESRLDAHIVNYADDFVICCTGTADKAMAVMRNMMNQMKLTVNEAKTHIRTLPEETFDFLGYTVGQVYSWKSRRMIYGTRPSRKKVQSLCETIHELTDRRWTWKDEADQIRRLNEKLNGWSNYFCLGVVDRAYRAIDQQVRARLRRWLCRKHKISGSGCREYPDVKLTAMGLVTLSTSSRSKPSAKSCRPDPRAGCGKSARPVR